MKKQNNNTNDSANLNQKAEFQLSKADMLKKIHELEAQQHELELQNKELKLVKETAYLTEKKYTSLFSSMLEAFALHEIICDANGKPIDYRFLDMNPAFEKLTGIKKGDALNKTVLTILPETESLWIEKYGKVALTGEPIIFENYTIALKRHFHVVAFSPEKNKFAVIFTDITDIKQSEKALRESEKKFRAIFENNSSAIAIIEPDSTISMVNEEYCKMSGYNMQEVIGMSWTQQIPQDDLERLKEYNRKRLLNPNDAPDKYEFSFYCKNGEIKHALMSLTMLSNRKIITSFVDITERKKAEETIRNTEKNYRQITDNISDVIWTCNLNLKLTFISPSYLKLIGETAEEFYKRSLEERFPKGTMGMIESMIKEELEKEKDPSCDKNRLRIFELEHYCVDGTTIWLEMKVSFLRDNNSNVIGFQGITRNVTEQKQIEDALLESEEKYSKAFKTSPYAITITSVEDGKFIEVNDVFTLITGFTREEAIADTFVSFDIWVDLKNREQVISLLLANKDVKDKEFLFKKKNGEIITGSFSANIIHIKNANYILSSINDITERKLTENLLAQTRQNYETFFNTIDEFLFVLDETGNIIHTNVTVIDRLGYTSQELFKKSILMLHPSERREEAGRIVNEMLNGKADFCQVPIVTKSGEQIPVETRVSHGLWDGKPVIFGVTKDISKIRLSEEKFSKVFYLNPSACGLSDLLSGKYIEVNDAFCTLLGYDKNEVIGKTATDLGLLTKEAINAIILKTDNNGKGNNIEADLKAKNGDIKHVLLSAENINVQEQKYRYTVVQDMTQYKLAENALRESEKKYRLLTEHSADVIWVLNLTTGKFEYISPSVFQLRGFTPDEAMNERLEDSLTPESIIIVKDTIAKNINNFIKNPEGHDNIITEIQQYCKSGQIIWIEISTHVRYNSKGEIEVVGASRNIDIRKKAEEEIHKWTNIFKNAKWGVAATNAESTKFELINRAFAEMHGFSVEELNTKSIIEI
ncbi:MAG: PAS domain S-box protein, partial [Bacteroidetes bacterium]|nr:PAS domain S-box protein [Bacteroidota bacterium]